MRYDLLICSDTHEAAPQVIPIPGAICWLHAGDFYLNKDVATGEDELDAQYAQTIGMLEGGEAYQWFKNCHLPIYAVRGNHDGYDAWGFFRTAHDISGVVVRIASQLLLAGIGWYGRNYCDLPSDSDFDCVCSALSDSVRRLKKPGDLLIMLSHYPIYAPPVAQSSADAFQRLRVLAEEIHPAVIVQGHVHQWSGMRYQVLMGSQSLLVVNPGAAGGVLSVEPAVGAFAFC